MENETKSDTEEAQFSNYELIAMTKELTNGLFDGMYRLFEKLNFSNYEGKFS